MLSSDGDVIYEGDWEFDSYCGQGSKTYATGAVYTGAVYLFALIPSHLKQARLSTGSVSAEARVPTRMGASTRVRGKTIGHMVKVCYLVQPSLFIIA